PALPARHLSGARGRDPEGPGRARASPPCVRPVRPPLLGGHAHGPDPRAAPRVVAGAGTVIVAYVEPSGESPELARAEAIAAAEALGGSAGPAEIDGLVT